MNRIKPDYVNLGLSTPMGPMLRKLVEDQLSEDLRLYGVEGAEFKFDWSHSCIEGRDTNYLDGSLDCYSGISVFDADDNFIAEGWMGFIHELDFFLVYWDDVTIDKEGETIKQKEGFGLPDHVWNRMPDHLKSNYERYR